jgi:hypothetical protein
MESTAELKGTAYSLGGGIAAFVVVFLLMLRSYSNMMRELPRSTRLDERSYQRLLEESIGKVVHDKGVVERVVKTIRGADLIVDSSPLLGSKGFAWSVPYEQYKSVQELLDDIWSALPHDRVRPYSYEKDWILENAESHKAFRGIGTLGGKRARDTRTLKQVGITQGMRLLVSAPKL